MKILITGGSGFVGRNLIPYLIRQYPHCRITNLDREEWVLDKKQYSFRQGDIRKQEFVDKVIKEDDIEMLINLVDDDSPETVKQIESNVCGQYVLLKLAIENKLERFLFLSSDDVYTRHGKTFSQPVTESDTAEASDLASAYKISAESLAKSFYHQYQAPIIIFRCPACLGPWLQPKTLPGLLISNALLNNTLPLYHEGKKSQEWLHISDLCRAIDKALHLKTLQGEIYNLGWETTYTVLEMSKIILTYLGKAESLIHFLESEKSCLSKPALDTSRSAKSLGWKPETSFTEALQKTVDWYQDHPDWWQ